MDKETEDIINQICWWIPFKHKRNTLRNLLINKLKSINKPQKEGIKPIDIELIKEFKKSINEDKNFKNKYLSFINNLDENSINNFVDIISEICNYDNQYEYYFNDKKTLEYHKMQKEFHKKIIKISDGIYAYRNYLLPINAFGESVFYHKHGLDIINQEYLQNKDIIDAGGFIGDSAIVFSKYTNKKVYSFEPFERNYNMMLETIKLNNINNIVPLHLSLGDQNTSLKTFSKNKITAGQYLISDKITDDRNFEENIDMITLDKFVDDNNLEVGFIKTDLEGFEQRFLKGAVNTIKKFKPTLSISIYHNYSDFLEIKEWLENLKLGYHFSIIQCESKKLIVDTTLIAEV